MSEVIRQAAAAHHYLSVFDYHTDNCFTVFVADGWRRRAQRIVLYARDRGCTFPGCTKTSYHNEVHHRPPIGPTADKPTSMTRLWPAHRESPRQTRRLADPKT